MASAINVLYLRLAGAVAASAAFGLIAVRVLPAESLPAAIGLGFLFGTSFIGGTGYRIILAAAARRQEPAPASWSGATAGAALLALAMWAIVRFAGGDGSPVLLGFGIGINIAYLMAKAACFTAGCCHAADDRFNADLRLIEIVATTMALGGGAVLALVSVPLGAAAAIGGHLAVRMVSRHWRKRWSWGWPPLRQPGAEIAPLAAALAAAIISL